MARRVDYEEVHQLQMFSWVALALRGGMPLAKRALGRVLDLSVEKVESAFGEIDRTMDDVAEMLSDGRMFLLGERFTAADLTFAAMTAPRVLPERYGVPLPRVDEIPTDAAAHVTRWREHPAGRFAMKLYEARPAPRGR